MDFLTSKLKINLNNRNWYIVWGDVILSILSAIGAYIFRLELVEVLSNYYSSLPWLLLSSLTFRLIIFYIFGIYRIMWEYARIRKFILIFLAITISSVLIAVIMQILLANNVFISFPRSILLIDWVLSLVFMGGLRFGPRVFYKLSNKPKNKESLVKSIHGSEVNILIKNMDKLMILIVFLYGFAYLLFGKVISVHDGFGWDGQVYRNITKSFGSALILSKKLNAYSIQRIFPSALVHFGLKLFQLPKTNEVILSGFRIINFLLMLCSVYIFVKITNELKFSITGKLLCFLGLFLNFAISKQFFYYPVLTDQMAFTLGLLILYYFLKRNNMGLIITTLVGSLTWPLMIYYGLLLYIFPRRDDIVFHKRKKLSLLISILAVLILSLGYVWVYFIRNIQMPESSIQINDTYVFISIFCSIIYIFFGFKNLMDEIGIPDFQKIKESISIARIFTGLLFFVLVKVFVNFLSGDSSTSLSTISFIERVTVSSIVRPFNFYIAHVVYFGPIILLITFLWEPINRIVQRYGLGLFLFIVVNFILSLFSESRALIPAFSFFVLFSVAAIEEYKWPSWFYWGFGIVSFIFSKIWLPLGNIPLSGGYYNFPYQWYFMNYGPWMSNQMYAFQGFFVLISGIIFFIVIKEIIHLQSK